MHRAGLLLLLLLSACATRGDDDDAFPDDDDRPFDDDDSGDDDDTGDDDDSTPAVLDSFDDVLTVLQTETDPDALDTLLHTVGWRWRWPLVDGDRWLFATRWEGSPSLAGDVTGWEPVAATAAGPRHHWVLMEASTFLVPAAGAKYKWTEGGTWAEGFESTAHGWDQNGAFSYVAPPTDRSWLERFPDLSTEALPLPRTVRALLPAGFDAAIDGASARTLLLQDGQNLFDPTAFAGGWEVDVALDAPEWADVVALAVDTGADRLDVYGHVQDEPFGDGQRYGGKAAEYATLLEDEVLPFARGRYGIRATGDSLAVAGSSMGGLVSLWLGARWDGEVGCVGALSPTLRWGAMQDDLDGSEALVNRWATTPGHGDAGIFLYAGGNEGFGCVDTDGDGVVEESQDQDNHCVTAQFRDALAALGYQFDVDLVHWWEPGAQHTEPAWRAQVPRMLTACEAMGWSGD